MNYYIFRHGETYFSKHHIPYGDQVETAEILPEKIPVIEKLANYFKDIPTDTNFSSPYRRCHQTVEIVSKITGKIFSFDYRLRDWIPEKETKRQLIDRVTKFVEEIKTQPVNSVSICTHGYPINAIVTYLTQGFVREEDLENFPRPGVVVSVIDGKVSYKDFTGLKISRSLEDTSKR